MVKPFGENNFSNFVKRFLYCKQKKIEHRVNINEIIRTKTIQVNPFHQYFTISNKEKIVSLSIK
jgi:hypothetical protein